MEEFFIICTPGLESIVLDELELKYPLHFNSTYKLGKVEKGGISLELPLTHGFLLNRILKTPTRILLRLKTQKCRDISKFYNIIKKFEWGKLLNQESLDCVISCKESRLFQTNKIESSFKKAIKDYFNANHLSQKTIEQFKNNPTQTLYIRLYKDDLTLSLDTSGEKLYKRDDKKIMSQAPIRENIASALVFYLIKTSKLKNIHLIDPMCGSGNFLFEAINFFNLSKRNFHYEYLNESFVKEVPHIQDKNSLFSIDKVMGKDTNSKLIQSLQALNSNIIFTKQDAFSDHKSEAKNTILISNPPFGKRLKLPVPATQFYSELINKNIDNYKPKIMGHLIPRSYSKFITYKSKLSFNYQGIDLDFVLHF